MLIVKNQINLESSTNAMIMQTENLYFVVVAGEFPLKNHDSDSNSHGIALNSFSLEFCDPQ